MSAARSRLEELKAKMTDTQRKDMAEIIANELRARQEAKARESSAVKSSKLNTDLSTDDLGSIYGQVDVDRQRKKVEEIERKIRSAKKHQGRVALENAAKQEVTQLAALQQAESKMNFVSLKSAALMGAIVLLAAGKIAVSTGAVNSSSEAEAKGPKASVSEPASVGEDLNDPSAVTTPYIAPVRTNWSDIEKELLTELDSRRVELEKRRVDLDRRESELTVKEQELVQRLVELKSLTRRLTEIRKEKDYQYEARLEQLANVYGSMAPQEAAPLIGKLDEQIALALLKRMPGKRMGQILSLMDQERAIELTRLLTDKKQLD